MLLSITKRRVAAALLCIPLVVVVVDALSIGGGGGSSSQRSDNSGAVAITPTPPTKVVVSGASGRTGRLVFASLLKDPCFQPKAMVRSEKSAKKLLRQVPETELDQIVVCDVVTDAMPTCMEGYQAMVICTSAVPTVSKRSLLSNILKIPWSMIRFRKVIDFRSLKFVWKNAQYPELVDYHGQKAQIDMAKRLGFKQVVVVSSMGGTDPSMFLNSVGKNKDGSGHGDILLWKRKAEKYLIDTGKEHDMDYTIIHAGGLVDSGAGIRQLVLDVDDKLLTEDKKCRSVCRADVANLCHAALMVGKGHQVSFDCTSRPVPAAAADGGGAVPSSEEALRDFLQHGKTCHY